MKALLLVAHGTEEMEAVISSDVLSRAGIHVTRASVGVHAGEPVGCANGLKIHAEERLEDIYDAGRALEYNVLVLPGGSKGSQTFCTDHRVQSILKDFANSEKHLIGAICAAPMAVWKAGIFPGARVTCYPGCESQAGGYKFHGEMDVVIDGRLITSRGPGTACDFALAIVKEMKGSEVRDKVAAALLHH